MVESFAEAFNAQDPDRAMAHLAEDAVVSIVPATPGTPGTYTGQAEIRHWLEGLMALNAQLEVAIQSIEEGTVTVVTRYSDDALQELGVRYLEGAEEYIVQKGKISRRTFTTSEKSLAELQLATLKAATPTHADVPYLDDGDPKHILDIYLPAGEEGPFPHMRQLKRASDRRSSSRRRIETTGAGSRQAAWSRYAAKAATRPALPA